MVLESAEILVKAGMEEAFEAAVAQAAPLFKRARGCTGLRRAQRPVLFCDHSQTTEQGRNQ